MCDSRIMKGPQTVAQLVRHDLARPPATLVPDDATHRLTGMNSARFIIIPTALWRVGRQMTA